MRRSSCFFPIKKGKTKLKGIAGSSQFEDPHQVLGYNKSPVSPRAQGVNGRYHGGGNPAPYQAEGEIEKIVEKPANKQTKSVEEKVKDVDYEGTGLFSRCIDAIEDPDNIGAHPGDKPFYDSDTDFRINNLLREHGF